MSTSRTALTRTNLIAVAADVLKSGGYAQSTGAFADWETSDSRIFEDAYNVVGIAVFETCGDLLRSWPEKQQSLAEVISRYVGRSDAKSWDGYLVLLTPAVAPSEEQIDEIRYNTMRLRKLVATGDDLQTPEDVRRMLSPLLPLAQQQGELTQKSALDLLPRVLLRQGISKEITQLLINAFREQAPLLDRLHNYKRKT